MGAKQAAVGTKKPPARVRMVDIARRAGVSQPAVSAVLNGKTGVSTKTAAKIIRIASELNYHPSHAAMQLVGRSSELIGLISSHWHDSFNMRAFYWLDQAAKALGRSVLSSSGSDIKELRRAVSDCQSRQVEGTICLGYGPGTYEPAVDEPAVSKTLAQLPHLVSLFAPVAVAGSVCVDLDEADGIRQAVLHLYERGRKRIGLLLPVAEQVSADKRRQGFLAVHRELGRGVQADQIHREAVRWLWDIPQTPGRIDAVIEKMVTKDKADALIAPDDFAAAYLIQRLSRRGLRVPEDVAVVGYENDSIAHHLSPALTTVNMPVKEMVTAAVEMIVKATTQNDTTLLRSQTFKPTLMIRGTTVSEN